MKNFSLKFRRLSLNQKALFFFLILAFIFTFLRWFYYIETTLIPGGEVKEIERYFNAYQGVTAVMGYFYSFFLLSTLGMFLFSMYDNYLQGVIQKKPWLYTLFVSEALFLLVLMFLVYTSDTLSADFRKSGVCIPLFLEGIFTLGALFSAHFYWIYEKKNATKKQFLEQMKGSVSLEPEEIKKEDKEVQQMSLGDFYIDK